MPADRSSRNNPNPDVRTNPGADGPSGPLPPADGVVSAAGQRPLPEYELVGLLGRGGFGEVWKAHGPGGFPVALKFVRLGERACESELRALELMKGIRHGNLLPMFGAWQRGGMLIVAMELADRSLYDRLREAQTQGLEGIPAEELGEYLRDAARGLDYLNERHHPSGSGGVAGIQHKDVKPANLLLVGGTVKVADFGLAKLMEHTVSQASSSMTPAYTAPEFLKGQATRWSDQYCLAVTYCHLRGGRLPFDGGNVHQILCGHMMNEPDLTMLPERERPAVARALAKKPEERWGSCREFAEAVISTLRPPVGLAVVPVKERREEGEDRLTDLIRDCLKLGAGRLSDDDQERVKALCRHYRISAARTNVLFRELREQWEATRYLARGRLALAQGNYQEAREALTRCLQLRPNLAEAFHLRGTVCSHLDRHAEALADLHQAVLLDPQYTVSYCSQRARLHLAEGEPAQALAEYAVVLQLDPTNEAALLGREQALEAVRAPRPSPVLRSQRRAPRPRKPDN
jgi:serine/threonine protein kinase